MINVPYEYVRKLILYRFSCDMDFSLFVSESHSRRKQLDWDSETCGKTYKMHIIPYFPLPRIYIFSNSRAYGRRDCVISQYVQFPHSRSGATNVHD